MHVNYNMTDAQRKTTTRVIIVLIQTDEDLHFVLYRVSSVILLVDGNFHNIIMLLLESALCSVILCSNCIPEIEKSTHF